MRKYIAKINIPKELLKESTGYIGEKVFEQWFINNFQGEQLFKQNKDRDFQGIDFVDDKGYKYQVKAKEWKQEKKVLKDKLKTYSDHVKELQVIFNKFIRARDNGLPCISCGNPNMKKVNASHYYNANNHYAVRFNEDNVHSACEYCNTYLSGNLIPYREALIKKIGIERFEYLESIANDTMKYSIPELIELKVIYKDKIKQL